ncbi:MAG: hypothetical protein HY791_33485 [Deltaproteobacteria bacterium]|nr:hypothetical protein [Deltaproteobacteria bacterium]
MGASKPKYAALKSFGPTGILIALLAYALMPSLVLAPIENDEIRIALGVARFHSAGTWDLAYRFETQPGTHLVLSAVSRAFGAPPLEAFAWVSLLAVSIAFVAAATFVSRMTSLSFTVAGLALLVFQEIAVSAIYGSSTALSQGPLWVACALLATKGVPSAVVAASALAFALAIWLRFDAALLGPLWAYLLLRQGRRKLIGGALGAVVTVAALFLASGANPAKVLEVYRLHTSKGSAGVSSARVLLTLFTALSLYLMVVGRRAITRETGAMIALGAIPLGLAYAPALTTPKYLVGLLPLCAIAVAHGLGAVANSRRVAICAGLLFAAQYLVPVPIEPRVITADGPRFFAEILHGPAWWRAEKRRVRADEAVVREKLLAYAVRPNGTVVVSGWNAGESVPYELLVAGFALTSRTAREGFEELGFERRGRRVTVAKFPPDGVGVQAYLRANGGLLVSD